MAFSFRNKDVYINAQKSENAPVPTAAVLPIQTVVPSETAFDEEMHTLEVSAERASEIVAGGTGSEQPIVTSPYMSAYQGMDHNGKYHSQHGNQQTVSQGIPEVRYLHRFFEIAETEAFR